ncbi:hypothetical protein D0812_20455 [Vibrio owensii]|uniref:Uncharacterized protein n=1 Tax=Vibrio owensii TaxID=696485 RepID=A0AAP9KBS2_9VIBR|nr:hypothetical protein [Vibrio owensii]AYO16775.1 hypothetical protein D0812_20455 [Vibrio owensii]QGH48939.1 hypothetical protein APZ19_17520 [Vibrio owensii]
MKRLAGLAAMALFLSTGAVANPWVVGSDEGRADFYVKFKGEVPKRCEMMSYNNMQTIDFDLTKAEDKKVFGFKTWCNSYGTKGIVQVDPFGFVNSNKDEIPMAYSFNGENSLKEKGVDTTAARIHTMVEISNNLDKTMTDEHQLSITSKPQAGARWGEYSGAMYVTLFHM